MSYYLNSAISFKLQNFQNQKKTTIKMIKPTYLSLDTKMYIKLAHKSMKIIREKNRSQNTEFISVTNMKQKGMEWGISTK